MNFPTFKIRCSGIGKIMTDPRGKSVREKIDDLKIVLAASMEKLSVTKDTLKTYSNIEAKIAVINEKIKALQPYIDAPNLSETCISFLESWANEFAYNRRVDFSSKYTAKGTAVEEDAINYASGHIPEMGLSSKNLTRFRDEYLEGEPDVISAEYVFDTKASFSHETFPLYSKDLPEPAYDWQVLGYMSLTGKKKGRVVYVLMDMPEEMIIKEARWKLGSEYTRPQYDEFAAQYLYNDLPAYLRIKEYEIPYDEEKVEAIKNRVLQCREYINNVIVPSIEANAKKYQ